ncbi:protein of unknown function (DUF4419) domain containing protein [Rhypophila decipiens]
MPVTIRTHPIGGDTWLMSTTTDAQAILKTKVELRNLGKNGLMQSTFDPHSPSTSSKAPETNVGITPSHNGLVQSAIEAWNNHHHLVLRPDDIWLAILCQLGFFINANAEQLRTFFVAHEGKKQLEVWQEGDPDSVDYAWFAEAMTEEISKNVNDPEMVPWILPEFTTTTENDRVVGAVLLMGAMQKYFDYNFCCETCGIPSVTLLGTREDWVDLQNRVKKIREFPHKEADEFCSLLEPLARWFVKSFDEPLSKEVLEFWRVIASRERPRYNMSGGPSELLTGWISTFCFWDEDGKKNTFHQYRPEDSVVKVDGVEYFPIDPADVVAGWSTVPVKVKWFHNGELIEVRKCKMVAGSVGMRPGRHADLGVQLEGLPLPEKEGAGEPESEDDVIDVFKYGGRRADTLRQRRQRRLMSQQSRREGAPAAELGFDAVAPELGWWIYETNEDPDEEDVIEKGHKKRQCAPSCSTS